MNLKQLPKKALELTAETSTFQTEHDGKTWEIHKGLSFDEFFEYEQLEKLFADGTSWHDNFEEDKKIWELLKKSNWPEVAVIIHNRMNRIKGNMESRFNTSLYICALFIHEKDNRKPYSKQVAEEKIESWKKEYEYGSFFRLACTLVRGYIESYNSDFRTILSGTNQNQNGKSNEKEVSRPEGTNGESITDNGKPDGSSSGQE